MTPSDYSGVFNAIQLTTKPPQIMSLDYIARVAITHQEIYTDVERKTRVPWWVVAALHARESDQDFSKHLHNGDPLTARTVHVPSGRPAQGSPPFTWQQSAIDALADRWWPQLWCLSSALEFCERYNGLGYQKRGVMSPYLWSWTSGYQSGLYVADGTFDPKAVSKQPGVAAIFKTLQNKGVSLDLGALTC